MFRAVKTILDNPSRQRLGRGQGSSKAHWGPGKGCILVGAPEDCMEAVGSPGPKVDRTQDRTGRAVWEAQGNQDLPQSLSRKLESSFPAAPHDSCSGLDLNDPTGWDPVPVLEQTLKRAAVRKGQPCHVPGTVWTHGMWSCCILTPALELGIIVEMRELTLKERRSSFRSHGE